MSNGAEKLSLFLHEFPWSVRLTETDQGAIIMGNIEKAWKRTLSEEGIRERPHLLQAAFAGTGTVTALEPPTERETE